MKFCKTEDSTDTFWGNDKIFHMLWHAFMAVCIGLFNPWVAIVVCEIWGFGTEVVECTNLFDKVTKFIDKGTSKARCMSIKDLIVNNVGMLAGLVLAYLLCKKFGI